jgi:hypothetical protein
VYKDGKLKVEKSVRDYLNLIKESIHGNDLTEGDDYSRTDWEKVVKLAAETGMLGIVFKRLKAIAKETDVLKPQVSNMETTVILRGISEAGKKSILKKVIKIAREEEVPVLVFKGVVLSSLYPEPSMRFSSDTDMYIDEKDRDRMVSILERLGYVFDKEDSNENVVKYMLPGKHYIELHSKLWSFVKGTKIDVLESMKLTEKRVHATFDGVECDTIDYGEQLIFLMFHLYKHLMFEHANIRFLTDIMLFFYAHADEMDLKLLKERMVLLEYWHFFSQMYGIAVGFLGFDRLPAMEQLSPEAFDEKAAESAIAELMLLNRDEFDEQNLFQLTYNMMPYLTGDNSRLDKRGKGFERVCYLFPGVKDFPEEYAYVRKCPILLPIGWIHRIAKYTYDRIFRKDERISGAVRMNKVDAKVERLRQMGLIK